MTTTTTDLLTAPEGRKKSDLARDKVLDAAALQMNRKGSASVDLNSVSEAVGLSRNALYHYFKNRRELAYHCYLLADRELAQDLVLATSAGGSAAEQLRLLVSANFAKDKPARAALHYLGALELAEQEVVVRLHRKNLAAVESILAGGVQRGEFRQINIVIAAQVLLGMMDWARLWSLDAEGETENAFNLHAISPSIISDVLLEGVAKDRNYALTKTPDLASITAREFNAFDTQAINKEKRLQLLGTASRLFNQRGIEATSVDDIAAELGTTKGAIYHYFDNKNQLLLACYDNAFEMYDQFIEVSERDSNSTFDRMLTIMHLNCQAQASRQPPLIVQSAPLSLPTAYAHRVLQISSRLDKMRIGAVEQGLCRIDDPAVANVSAGAFFWVQKWITEKPALKPRMLADEVCSIYSRGISA